MCLDLILRTLTYCRRVVSRAPRARSVPAKTRKSTREQEIGARINPLATDSRARVHTHTHTHTTRTHARTQTTHTHTHTHTHTYIYIEG